jgi:O-antigen/teichoic acid export membrane protein
VNPQATARGQRTRRSALHFATNLLGMLVALVVGFAATPLLLRWLGSERFGAFRALGEWFAYLSLVPVALTAVFGPMLASSVAAGDQDRLRSVFAMGLRMFAGLSIVLVVVGVVLTSTISRLVPVGQEAQSDLRNAAIVSAATIVLIVFVLLRQFLEAKQRGYWVNLLMIGQSLIVTSLSLAFSHAGLGMTGMALASALGQLFTLVAISSLLWRQFPGLFSSSRAAAPSVEKEFWHLNWSTLGLQLSGQVSVASDAAIVAAFRGSSAVVTLVITQRLAWLLQSQLQGIGNATWAALAQLHGQGHMDAFRESLIEITGLVATLACAGLIPVLAYNREFISLWVGEQHYGGALMTAAACVISFSHALLSFWGWSFVGTGNVRAIIWPYVISAAINLAASILLTRGYGPIGALLGTLLSFALILLWALPWLLRHVFAVPLDRLLKAALSPLLLAFPVGALACLLSAQATRVGWLELVSRMALLSALYLALAWLTLLDRPTRRRVWMRATAIFT